MRWFRALWHCSSVVRLAVRGVVLALTALPLMVLALKLQPEIPVLSRPMAILVLTGLLLIEGTLIVVVKFLFRKVQ
jgi:hypothetical protein